MDWGGSLQPPPADGAHGNPGPWWGHRGVRVAAGLTSPSGPGGVVPGPTVLSGVHGSVFTSLKVGKR